MHFSGRDRWRFVTLVVLAISVLALGNLMYNVERLQTDEEILPPFGGGGGAELPEEPPPSEGAGPEFPSGTFPAIPFNILYLVPLVAVVGAAIAVALRRMKKTKPLIVAIRGPGTIASLLFLATVIAFLVFWKGAVGAVNELIGNEEGSPPAPTDGTTSPAGGSFPVGIVMLLLLLAALAISLIIAATISRSRGIRLPLCGDDETRLEAASLTEKAIYSLRVGDDPRSAILEYYKAMCVLFENAGLKAEQSLTAREFEALATRELNLSERGVKSLTWLFEEARYSTHPMAEAERDKALNALTMVKGELEAFDVGKEG